jgi:hypothetical protein
MSVVMEEGAIVGSYVGVPVVGNAAGELEGGFVMGDVIGDAVVGATGGVRGDSVTLVGVGG